ncbi:xanthine dehydrogenase accessory protein XdhC [Thiosulfativibrio zosterae]|uniref:Xanthine dehydrogenase accessory protein XdhC n=1 Tax=Thiosulfativibrio zosterae TaxID=2675053 RepID=A0A6F8PPC4_9GAMM|nr:xanthine dehydrogenase accessory protein XdhC [Thiosulfativibrio zosterae]BBP43888.1 xanthine dehydrogenase accessory protein XdhC [Thiosulfativibrio zosterae]
MLNWTRLATLAQQTEIFMLVSVAKVQGSSPREVGAKMAVFANRIEGTIGGGHLEYAAIEQAKTLLNQAPDHHISLTQTPLTPRFDQCCGGQVTLVFEKINPITSPWLNDLARLLKPFSAEKPPKFNQAWLVFDPISFKKHISQSPPQPEKHLIIETIQPHPFPIMIFGAGHVGKALVNQLQFLDAKVTLVDSRADQFPEQPPAHIQCITTQNWQSLIDSAPSHTYFLILTHSHQLDFALTQAILQKGQFAYCGLIGSKTKKVRFERQLSANGLTQPQIASLTCPIGLHNIPGKSPEILAISVVAQLLQIQAQASSLKPSTHKELRHVTAQL